jgi:hypothetical protein
MRSWMIKLCIVGSACLFANAAYAGWQDRASQFDQQRLSRIDEARNKALSQARGGGDMAAIESAMRPHPVRASDSELVGNWRCRTLKLGGVTPSRVYDWFRCRIRRAHGGLYLEKLTGSQYTNGYLYPDRGGFVYLGGSSVIGEPRHQYSGSGVEAGAPGTPDDQIGMFYYLGRGHARLEMPYPLLESTMDVLELRR